MWGAIGGAALGLLKSGVSDAEKERREKKIAGTTMRYSPWTGMKADKVTYADPFGEMLKGGMAGAMMGQGGGGGAMGGLGGLGGLGSLFGGGGAGGDAARGVASTGGGRASLFSDDERASLFSNWPGMR